MLDAVKLVVVYGPHRAGARIAKVRRLEHVHALVAHPRSPKKRAPPRPKALDCAGRHPAVRRGRKRALAQRSPQVRRGSEVAGEKSAHKRQAANIGGGQVEEGS